MVSDHQLRRKYLDFNRLYWGGQLPSNVTVLWEPVSADLRAETTRNEDGTFTIRISPGIAGFWRFSCLTLLHEMAHIAKWRGYCDRGKVWKEEMLRVLEMGGWRYL